MSTTKPNPHAFVTVFVGGVEIDVDAERNVVVHTDGTVIHKPAPVNDTGIQAPKEALEIGAKMSDGSVFAGLTDGTGSWLGRLFNGSSKNPPKAPPPPPPRPKAR